MDAGLVSADEFHYSKKGKEISHYKLANKYIIIAPKKTLGLKEKLKNIFPVVLVVSGAALVIQYLSKPSVIVPQVQPMVAKSFESSTAAAPMMAGTAQNVSSSTPVLLQNIALWFFCRGGFCIDCILNNKLIEKK